MIDPVRVIKLGGSLLDWPELPARFLGWLGSEPPAANVVVVGGGTLVEGLRQLDAAWSLPDELVHWTAIRLMDLMAELTAARIDRATLLHDAGRIDRTGDTGPQLLCVESLLRGDAGSSEALPCSWMVTSDSIAARVAAILQASELVLLKSASPESNTTASDWAEAGLVDPYFPRALATARTRLVNLREFAAPEHYHLGQNAPVRSR